MSDNLKVKLGYMVPAHVELQSGAGTNAPAAVFADYDYDVEDGNCGLHQSAKQAWEPAIVYVRADALDARDAEIKRLRETLGGLHDALGLCREDHELRRDYGELGLDWIKRARTALNGGDNEG